MRNMYAHQLGIGVELEYSADYVDAWQTSYLEGRSEWSDFDNVRRHQFVLVGLTMEPGLVIVETKGSSTHSVQQIHIDNLQPLERTVWLLEEES